MACVDLQLIDGDECIGASLPKINGNFAALSAAVCDLSGFNVFDSPTIDLSWNSTTRTLSADVKDVSITNAKIAFDGGAFAFRNKIINGNFDIWQRGVTTTASNNNSHTGFYSADRWGFSPNLAGTVTVSQSAFDITQTSVPNNPNVYLSYNCSVGSSGTPFLYQRIENVRLLAGKTVTLSFYAKSSAPLAVSVGYSQWYGLPAALGGTFSNQTNTSAGTINTTTSWAKYTITTTIPSIASGLTVDSAANTFFQVYFGFPSSTTFKFDIAQVQLEEGPTATPFEHRPIGTELALCQRYYQFEIGRYHTFPAGPYSEATHDIRITPMRTSPATTIMILGSARLGNYGSPLFGGTAEKLRFNADHDAATASAGYVLYSWTADAEL